MGEVIKTNNHVREFVGFLDIDLNKVADNYNKPSNLKRHDVHWIKYRGIYYNLADFMPFEGYEAEGDWDGIYCMTNTCAIFIKMVNDGENYIIGTGGYEL